MFSTAVIDVEHRQVVHQITLPSVPAAVLSFGQKLTNVPEPVVASAWSSDGRRLFLATQGARGRLARFRRSGGHGELETDRSGTAGRRRGGPRHQPGRPHHRPEHGQRRRRPRRRRHVPAEAPTARRRPLRQGQLLRRRHPARRRRRPAAERLGSPHRRARPRDRAGVRRCRNQRALAARQRTPSYTAARTDGPPSSTPTHRSSAASAFRSSPTPAPGMCTSPRRLTAARPLRGLSARRPCPARRRVPAHPVRLVGPRLLDRPA